MLRKAIANQQKIQLVYRSEKESAQTQALIVWPFTIGYFSDQRILVAWCENQETYRHFRTDKIASMEVLETQYFRPQNSLFKEWRALQLKK